MKKNMYYGVYDISDNNTRESVIQILKNHGFIRIQKSVFCGNLVNQQKKDLLVEIKSMLDETDSFYLLLSCEQCFGKVVILGKGFDKEYVSGNKGAKIF